MSIELGTRRRHYKESLGAINTFDRSVLSQGEPSIGTQVAALRANDFVEEGFDLDQEELEDEHFVIHESWDGVRCASPYGNEISVDSIADFCRDDPLTVILCFSAIFSFVCLFQSFSNVSTRTPDDLHEVFVFFLLASGIATAVCTLVVTGCAYMGHWIALLCAGLPCVLVGIGLDLTCAIGLWDTFDQIESPTVTRIGIGTSLTTLILYLPDIWYRQRLLRHWRIMRVVATSEKVTKEEHDAAERFVRDTRLHGDVHTSDSDDGADVNFGPGDRENPDTWAKLLLLASVLVPIVIIGTVMYLMSLE